MAVLVGFLGGLLMVRPEGRLVFANAQHVGDQMMALIERERPHGVAFDCSAIPDIEYSALKLLIERDGRLPVNVKVLVEGGEEIGSAGLASMASLMPSAVS